MYMYVCISYNMGKSSLPDIYTRFMARVYNYIRQTTSAHDITLTCLQGTLGCVCKKLSKRCGTHNCY